MPTKYLNKRGRKPLFTAAEVDEIQRAEGTIDQLAKVYRTSRATIARIRSYGYQYAPVDSPEKSRTHSAEATPRAKTSAFSNETLHAIAHDTRPQKVVAHEYGVSRPYVAKLRAKFGTTNRQLFVVNEQVDNVIAQSDQSIEELAVRFAIPELLIRRIKDNAASKDRR